ncbi:MAG: hypothetical protein AB7O26_01595 [Planctomycetaceae bacterium]
MSIEAAERLKTELTDKYVVVAKGVAELRRFAEKTGRVKTVNMNGRALVEFLGFEDIGWYDIDPSFLTVVPAPPPGKPAAAHAPAAKAAPEKSPDAAAKKPGLSPLELARQQGAAGSKPAAKPAAEGAAPGKKLSPLEMARMQGAAKAPGAAAAPKAEAAPAKPAAAPAAGKKLSPLEMARQQGAFKSGGAPAAPAAKPAAAPAKEAPPAEETEAPVAEAPAPAPAPAAAKAAGKPEVPAGSGPARTQAILELARKQGAKKS